MVFNRTEYYRHADPERVRIVWRILESMKAFKYYAPSDKIIKALRKETNLKDDQIRLLLDEIEGDGLIMKNLTKVSPDGYKLPDFARPCERGKHDWYCFKCHKPGQVRKCSECFRVYHLDCAQEEIKRHSSPIRSPIHDDDVDFTCPVCDTSPKCEYSRKQIRKLLDFATHHIKKGPLWKLFLTIGFKNNLVKNEYMVFKYIDLELLQQKIKHGRYTALESFALDVELLVHDVCILYGSFSNEADEARVFHRAIKSEIHEIELCTDCYINAKAKPSEWISKPCKPAHELIWVSHRTTAGAGMFSDAQISHYFWPAKILLERDDGYEIRFFGGTHERMFAKREHTKPYKTPVTQLELMRKNTNQNANVGGGFDKAWSEVNKLQANIDSGYYTHSSGESDLPPSEDEYSDELYLGPRRGAVLTSRRGLHANSISNANDSPRSSFSYKPIEQRKRHESSASSLSHHNSICGPSSPRNSGYESFKGAGRGGRGRKRISVIPVAGGQSSLAATLNALAETKAALRGKKIKSNRQQPMFRGINYPGSPKSIAAKSATTSPTSLSSKLNRNSVSSRGGRGRGKSIVARRRKNSSSISTSSSTSLSSSSKSSNRSSVGTSRKRSSSNILSAGTLTRPKAITGHTRQGSSSSSNSSLSSSSRSAAEFKAFKQKKSEASTIKTLMNGRRRSAKNPIKDSSPSLKSINPNSPIAGRKRIASVEVLTTIEDKTVPETKSSKRPRAGSIKTGTKRLGKRSTKQNNILKADESDLTDRCCSPYSTKSGESNSSRKKRQTKPISAQISSGKRSKASASLQASSNGPLSHGSSPSSNESNSKQPGLTISNQDTSLITSSNTLNSVPNCLTGSNSSPSFHMIKASELYHASGQPGIITNFGSQALPMGVSAAILGNTNTVGNLTLTHGITSSGIINTPGSQSAVIAAINAASSNNTMLTAAANLTGPNSLLGPGSNLLNSIPTGKQQASSIANTNASPHIPRSHLPPNKRAAAEAAALAMSGLGLPIANASISQTNISRSGSSPTTTSTAFYQTALLTGQTAITTGNQTRAGGLIIGPGGQFQLIPTSTTDIQAAANALVGLTPVSTVASASSSARQHRQGKAPANTGNVQAAAAGQCAVCKEHEKSIKALEADHKRALIELEERLNRHFQEEKNLAVRQACDQAQASYKEARERMQSEHREAIDALTIRMSDEIAQNKRRQWCRNCLKEAIYHCCWNTSYCSIPCQQEHWQKEHKRQCRRKR